MHKKKPGQRRYEILERTPSGRAKTYRDKKTGAVLTQYQKQKQQTGHTPREAALIKTVARELNIKRNAGRIGELLRRYQKTESERTGKRKRSITSVASDADFRQALKDLKTHGRKPDSKLAKALVKFGLRPSGAPYDVGDSPKRGRK